MWLTYIQFIPGNSLAVQWLGLHTLIAKGPVRCLVGELRLMRESFPRQADKKFRAPQEERGLEFSRRKKGQTFFPSIFLRII